MDEAATVEETASTRASGSNAISGSITGSITASASSSENASGSNAIGAGASSSSSSVSNATIRQVEADKAKANTDADEVEATDEEVDVSCTALPPPRRHHWACLVRAVRIVHVFRSRERPDTKLLVEPQRMLSVWTAPELARALTVDATNQRVSKAVGSGYGLVAVMGSMGTDEVMVVSRRSDAVSLMFNCGGGG